MRGSASLPGWWGALAAQGLAGLSPPELERSLDELTLERPAFVGLLERAADWPHTSTLGLRRPIEVDVRRLDRGLPRPRAVVASEDPEAVWAAAACFPVVLVLDPFWAVQGALYDAWHSPGELTPRHARRLLRMAAPAARLAPLVEAGAVRFVPNSLPASWEPWPMGPDSAAGSADSPLADATLSGARALHTAARLLYWGSRLRAVAAATLPAVAGPLRDLASAGPRLDGAPRERPVRLPALSSADEALGRWAARRFGSGPRARRGTWHGWHAAYRHSMARGGRAGPEPLARALADLVSEAAGAPWSGRGAQAPAREWRLGLGTTLLPSVSLALRYAAEGRPFRTGIAGTPCALQRPAVYLARA